MRWRPTPDWTAKLSLFGPDDVSSELAYRLWKRLASYAGFDWKQQHWLVGGRTDDSQRLFYDEKRWDLGLRFPVYRELRADLSVAYEFDRRMYEAKRATSGGVPDVEFSPAWSFRLNLTQRW